MSAFTIKQHDTAAAMKATLKDSAGAAVDLTGATVKFLMKSAGGTTKVNREVEVRSAAGGEVWVVFQTAEVDTVGFYRGEFEVTYGDASVETFPSSGYIPISIEPDLG